MSVSHASGPLFVCPVAQDWVEICDAPPDRNRGVLARVFPAGNDSSSRGLYTERDANARLFAAAPDLLEACKLAVEIIPLIRAGMGEGHPEYTRRIRAIDAAIARAIGE